MGRDEKRHSGVDFSGGREYGSGGMRRHALKNYRRIGGRAAESTGIRCKSDEPVGHALGEFMEALATTAGMAADLPMIEDQGQGVSQQPNHGQHHQSRTLVDRGVLEMAVGGDGLKNFCIEFANGCGCTDG